VQSAKSSVASFFEVKGNPFGDLIQLWRYCFVLHAANGDDSGRKAGVRFRYSSGNKYCNNGFILAADNAAFSVSSLQYTGATGGT
jgi:hypothetical protein